MDTFSFGHVYVVYVCMYIHLHDCGHTGEGCTHECVNMGVGIQNLPVGVSSVALHFVESGPLI